MINLIIDGNYLMHRMVFSLYKMNALDRLPIAIAENVKNWQNRFGYESIYFLSDTKRHWRKSIYQDYKASRKKSTDIDWNWVYEMYTEAKSILNSSKRRIAPGSSILLAAIIIGRFIKPIL
jgi:hypothetical protein